MTKKLIVGNWKMNQSLAESVAFTQAVIAPLAHLKQAEPVICPPYPWIAVLHGLVKNSPLKLGAQDVSAWKSGAYTGQVSADMLAPYCQYVIIGHSERRRYCQEDANQINQKINQAVAANLQPIVCVSNLQEVESLTKCKSVKKWLVAYEPLEAIGSGQPADPAQVKKMNQQIRDILGKSTIILYGGSASPDNIGTYLQISDGALVGGASLNPQSFLQLCQATEN